MQKQNKKSDIFKDNFPLYFIEKKKKNLLAIHNSLLKEFFF